MSISVSGYSKNKYSLTNMCSSLLLFAENLLGIEDPE